MAKIDFPKKQEQRLIPKYLLEYAEELQENHPDPSAEWGGGGGSPIEAGTGIVITTLPDNTKTISVDTEDVAMVQNLSNVAFSGDYDDLTNKPTIPSYTFTDGLTESSGTVSWDLNDRIAAGTGTNAVKEGYITDNVASGDYSHAEGRQNTASGVAAHAENDHTMALGKSSHAEGTKTIANHKSQHVFGEYNIADPSTNAATERGNYVEIVGNGPDSSYRSNARTLDWDGNEVLTGNLTVSESISDRAANTVNIADIVVDSDLATVATSGSYNDLSNKPTNLVTTDGSEIITGAKTFEAPITVVYDSIYGDQAQYKYDSVNYTNSSYNITIQPNPSSTGRMVIELPENGGTLALQSEIPTNVSDLYNDSGYITGITSSDVTSALGYTPYDASNPSGYITSSAISNMVTTDTSQTITGAKTFSQQLVANDGISSGDDVRIHSGGQLTISDNNPMLNYSLEIDANSILYRDNNSKSTIIEFNTPSNDNQLAFPNQSGTLAVTTDIPTATSDLTNDSGFITGIDSSDVISALGYTPGTSNFSGSYTDLTNKPDLSIYAQSANLATVATTGNYNDLTNKPTIPTVNYPVTDVEVDGVSVLNGTVAEITMPTVPTKTSDLTNDSGFITSSDLPTNHVTTDTNQNITGEKTFTGSKRIKFKQSALLDKLGFTGYDTSDNEIGYFEMQASDGNFTGHPSSNVLGYYSSTASSGPVPSADPMLGFKYKTKDSDGNAHDYKLVVPPRHSGTGTTYIPISVNGTQADNTGDISLAVPTTATSTSTVTPTTTQLVFTYTDDTTETITLMTGASVSTTTTLS